MVISDSSPEFLECPHRLHKTSTYYTELPHRLGATRRPSTLHTGRAAQYTGTDNSKLRHSPYNQFPGAIALAGGWHFGGGSEAAGENMEAVAAGPSSSRLS
jgi:hypothetical protein